MEELKNVDLDIGVKRKNIEFQKVNETIITTFIDGLGKFVVETYNAQVNILYLYLNFRLLFLFFISSIFICITYKGAKNGEFLHNMNGLRLLSD